MAHFRLPGSSATAASPTVSQSDHDAPLENSDAVNPLELQRLYGHGRSIDLGNPSDRAFLRERINEEIAWCELRIDYLERQDPEDNAHSFRLTEARKLLTFHRSALALLNQIEGDGEQ